MTRIFVTADTHIPDFARELPRALLRAAERADLILHAGDVTAAPTLVALANLAPVRVALGNNDDGSIAAFGAEEIVSFRVDEVSIAMVHDAGPRAGREPRLGRRFPGSDLVVFGHSHIPLIGELEGRRFLNPGSPTWKRRQARPTYAVVIVDGRRLRMRIVAL